MAYQSCSGDYTFEFREKMVVEQLLPVWLTHLLEKKNCR